MARNFNISCEERAHKIIRRNQEVCFAGDINGVPRVKQTIIVGHSRVTDIIDDSETYIIKLIRVYIIIRQLRDNLVARDSETLRLYVVYSHQDRIVIHRNR